MSDWQINRPGGSVVPWFRGSVVPWFRSSWPVLLPIAAIYALSAVPLLWWRPVGVDDRYWLEWAQQIQAHGIGRVYEAESANYGAISMFFVWLYTLIVRDPARLASDMVLLRLIVLVFDCGGALLVAYELRRAGLRVYPALLALLLNLTYWYDTVLWGQFDGATTLLAVLALAVALRGRAPAAAALLVLALNVKPQAVIYLPAIALALLPALRRRPIGVLSGLVAAALTQFVLLVPWLLAGTADQFAAAMAGVTESFPVISKRADNLWQLLLDGLPLHKLPDSATWAGLSYHAWGLLLFGGASLLALIPALAVVWRRLRAGAAFDALDRAALYGAAGLCNVTFFFFNTRMHERYSQGAILALALFAVLSGRYASYGLVSLGLLLNLEYINRVFGLWISPLSGRPRLVALIYLIGLVAGLYQLYAHTGLLAATRRRVSGLRLAEGGTQ